MDLSKAFDCLPHDLILAKLSAFGLSVNACDFLNSYLSNRKQRGKLGQLHSSWSNILIGVPQGSILGPLLFNIFMNDIFYFKKKASLNNYADDNTVSYSDKCLETTKEVLVNESIICIDWFKNNKLQANPDKFQAMMLGILGFENCKSLLLDGTEIKCEDSVKLLGVTFDYMMNFDKHISNICQKAARQIKVLLRLSKYLSTETKILIHKSFIRSNFNYCPLVWHFCSKNSSDEMEGTPSSAQ